ncbi:MAG: agmatine deiminase family protein, partial [Ignavibacteria bacterium]
SGSYSQDLPHILNDKEKELYKTYIPPGSITDDVNPPPSTVRTMAEWEELRGIIVAWTSYQSIIRQIIDYAQDEGLVYIVCSDSNIVKSNLTSGGVPLVNLKFIITPFNSVWCRDYGPWAAYSGVSDSMKMIDWIYNRPRPSDDQVPVGFSNFIGTPIFQAISSPNNLTHTGGNFMVDGHGTGFASKLILNENSGKNETQINNIANSYLGINRFIKMETLPYDQIHHIDMHMKLLDEETILMGQYPAGTADGPQIEANLQYVINNFQTCFGRPYKVVRIPMPPSGTGQYPPSANYYTYTNSVFVNKTVIVPIYGLSQDTTALRIYRENLPGYRVVGINCSGMISALGAIHCITKEIGVIEPVFISHAAIRDIQNVVNPYEVKAYIKTKSGVASAGVYWRTDTTLAYNVIPMTSSLDTFKATIPSHPVGTKVYYYISATSNSGRTVNKPLTAPAGYIKFVSNAPVDIKLNLTAVNEGMYLPSSNQLSRRDTFKVYLRNNFAPYSIADSAVSVIDSLILSGLFTFTNASSGAYYIVVKHLNSIETWSKTGGESISADGSVYNYDLTASASQAYGNNLKNIGSKYCMFSGDVDQNGIINLVDLIEVFNNSSIFSSGSYLPSDLNGDNTVNINDILICYNNPFVSIIRP